MRRLIYAVFTLAVCAGPFSFGQVISVVPNFGPIQTGFAVVTPLSGNGQGLGVSETFGMQVGGTVFQSSVPPSPLVTLSNVFINWDISTGVNTGIAIVNPNDISTTVTLNLLNEQGALIATRTLPMNARQQVSFFATELFLGIPEITRPFAGLLFVASNVPVGVLGLAFNGLSFNSLPVSVQLSADTVVAAGTFGTSPASFVPPLAPVTNTVTPPTVPVSSVPAPTTVPITGVTTPLVSVPGQVPPTFTVLPGQLPPTFVPNVAINTSTTAFSVATGQFTTPATISNVIVSTGGFLLPQVASGGGWVSQIMIGNASPTVQIVRVDFFDSSGAPMFLPIGASIPSLVVPAGGVVVLSTAM